MASIYSAFLQSPAAAHLAADATLTYITSTTAIHDSAAILKHLAAQQKSVEKKSEKILSTIEGADGLFLETETTLRFIQGGGAYLPSLDENLLDERVVTFPLLHVVNFDGAKKIKQIRLHWDQGTLLRQVEAIGRTGRNWPIRDGRAQIDAIVNSVKASDQDADGKVPLGSRDPNEVSITQNPKRDTVGALRNQPASLSLFAGRDPNEDAGSAYDGPKTAPRASARPEARAYGELFVGEETAALANPKGRSSSPSKGDAVFKSGAGKHYGDIRLFDENDGADALKSPPAKKTYDQKYDHFSFGDGEDAPEVNSRPSTRGHKNQPNFSFEDFTTPLKYTQRKRPDDEVHWGGEVDPPSPPHRPIVHAPRKDADTHFTLTDEATPKPAAKSTTTTLPSRHRAPNPSDLYRDRLGSSGNDEAFSSPASGLATRHNTTSTDNARRGNDFGSHYEISDENNENAAPASTGNNGSKRATRSDLESHWGWGTPEPDKKIYHTAGDGMGSRTGGRTWDIGEGEVAMPQRRGR